MYCVKFAEAQICTEPVNKQKSTSWYHKLFNQNKSDTQKTDVSSQDMHRRSSLPIVRYRTSISSFSVQTASSINISSAAFEDNEIASENSEFSEDTVGSSNILCGIIIIHVLQAENVPEWSSCFSNKTYVAVKSDSMKHSVKTDTCIGADPIFNQCLTIDSTVKLRFCEMFYFDPSIIIFKPWNMEVNKHAKKIENMLTVTGYW